MRTVWEDSENAVNAALICAISSNANSATNSQPRINLNCLKHLENARKVDSK